MTVTKFNKMGLRCPICKCQVKMSYDQIDYKDGSAPIVFGYHVGCTNCRNDDGIHDEKNMPSFFHLSNPDEAYERWLKFMEKQEG